MEWGSVIAWPSSGFESRGPTTPRSLAMLVIRSPSSGTTYTFTSDTVNDIQSLSSGNLKSMMVASTAVVPGQAQRVICVDANGVSVPDKIAIYISQAASSASAIETRTNATLEALGGVAGDSRC